MNYYKQKQFVAKIDKNDEILGKIEKWEAHKKGILHRGFTAILVHENRYVIQHRKHPVFDKVYDLSFSSHPTYHSIRLQTMEEAIYAGLEREWNIDKKDIKSEPRFVTKFYYKAKDPHSEFTEHEIDYIYKVELKKLPSPNFDFCYDFSLFNRGEFLKSKVYDLKSNLAPWVIIMLNKKIQRVLYTLSL